ncbi:hypothetical protein JOB18_039505 [Solea senegalensis]|uniref:Uncharacterized protein n=1 Tax=Solea senegalensis TaxID=28829 RepID=A0AAV6RV64_SOLSE|nr:hypothetical protein JOB18_039505 [Solea senegalensis]
MLKRRRRGTCRFKPSSPEDADVDAREFAREDISSRGQDLHPRTEIHRDTVCPSVVKHVLEKSENASRMDRNNLQVTDQWELQRTSSLHPQQPSRTPLTSGVQRMSSVPCLVCGDGQTRREAFKVVTFQSERGHELRTLQELRRIQTEDISKVHDRAQTLFLLRGDGDNKSPVGREGHSETEDRRVKHEEMEAAGGKVEEPGSRCWFKSRDSDHNMDSVSSPDVETLSTSCDETETHFPLWPRRGNGTSNSHWGKDSNVRSSGVFISRSCDYEDEDNPLSQCHHFPKLPFLPLYSGPRDSHLNSAVKWKVKQDQKLGSGQQSSPSASNTNNGFQKQSMTFQINRSCGHCGDFTEKRQRAAAQEETPCSTVMSVKT